ncbi:hypothetical protein B0I37DRAFT_420432 [Chaetomium sp. MPI-CAGE-AT-0009]|nr:hypothetical protein B0I37DRAFT_420432 [Chaetomium sp. MPI-CAGE-AT-0009]
MPLNDNVCSIIHATIGIAAADGGLAAARAVATIIDNVIHCVAASAPGADAQVTANVITNAITNYATAVEKEPGLSIDTIYAQAQNSVPVSSRKGLSEGLPEALENVGLALTRIEIWLPTNNNLAPAIVYAVAQVTDRLAGLSKSGGIQAFAGVWSDVAHRTVTILSSGVVRGSPPAQPFPRPCWWLTFWWLTFWWRTSGGERSGGDYVGDDLPSTGTGPRSCEAVLQTARLQAAVGALRSYGDNAHVLVALNALDAVATRDRLPHASEAGLGGVAKSLYALWTYNINGGNHEVVGVLEAVAAAAGLPPPPEGFGGF